MTRLTWWMRVVGLIYVLQFIMMVIVRAPIQTVGPAGALAQAAAGEPLARFLVDTWVTLGLVMLVIGVAMLITSSAPDKAKALIWTVIGIEISAGIVNDVYMIAHGYNLTVYAIWIVVHTVIITAGLIFIQEARSTEKAQL